METTIDPVKAAILYGFAYTLTDVIKGYLPIKGKGVQTLALVFAVGLNFGWSLTKKPHPSLEDLGAMAMESLVTGVLAIGSANLRRKREEDADTSPPAINPVDIPEADPLEIARQEAEQQRREEIAALEEQLRRLREGG